MPETATSSEFMICISVFPLAKVEDRMLVGMYTMGECVQQANTELSLYLEEVDIASTAVKNFNPTEGVLV
jgi:hypothetical protein